MSNSEAQEYLTGRPPSPKVEEGRCPEPIPLAIEEGSDIEVRFEGDEAVPLTGDFEMANPGGSGNRPYDFGSGSSYPGGESSFKYSHEETRPEKMHEKMKDLHKDMQDTLRRLDNLEAKFKSSSGKQKKKKKRPESTSSKRDEELQKALSNIVKNSSGDKSR